MPGQFENCEICSKRFTVTAYSKTGPDGGLVCTSCGKELGADDAASKKKAPKAATAAKRKRAMQSERLDGIVRRGGKPLVQLCIETVLKFHDSIESFENVPDHLMHRICRLFCKHRVLNTQTLPLFIQGDLTVIEIFDCSCRLIWIISQALTSADLKTEDYNMLIASAQRLRKLTLHNAYQFKDQNVTCMIEKLEYLTDLRIYAPNLVNPGMWEKLFARMGKKLHTLKLKWMDDTFQDKQVKKMVQCCPNLTRLKLGDLSHLGPDSIVAISEFRKLEHLSLDFRKDVDNALLADLIKSVGAKLQTLSLRSFVDIDADVLQAIHATCRALTKLRITPCGAATDAAWADLFAPSWRNPPLRRLHLSSARDVDNQNPDGPADAPVGVAGAAFAAILRHSAKGLERLDLASCRHVPPAALLAALAPDALRAEMDPDTGEDVVRAPAVLLPRLREADLSFVQHVDDVVLAGLFRAAPLLEKVALFGCFGVTSDVVVPRGVVVIGAPCLETEGIEMYGGAEREDPAQLMDLDGKTSGMYSSIAQVPDSDEEMVW